LRVNVFSCLIYYNETHVCQYIVLLNTFSYSVVYTDIPRINVQYLLSGRWVSGLNYFSRIRICDPVFRSPLLYSLTSDTVRFMLLKYRLNILLLRHRYKCKNRCDKCKIYNTLLQPLNSTRAQNSL
jgi:hypothetical protein